MVLNENNTSLFLVPKFSHFHQRKDRLAVQIFPKLLPSSFSFSHVAKEWVTRKLVGAMNCYKWCAQRQFDL